MQAAISVEDRDKITKYIRKVQEEASDKEELSVELWQAGQDAPVQGWTFEVDDDVEAIVDSILEEAEAHTRHGRSKRVNFEVRKPGGKKERGVFFVVSLYHQGGEYDEIPEDPSDAGIKSQQMRHNEMLVQTLVNTFKTSSELFQSQFKQLGKLVEAKEARIQQLEKERIKNIETFEALLQMQHERELSAKQIENSEKRKEQVASMITQLIPAIVNRLGGQKFMAEQSSYEAMIEAFLATFTPDQLQGAMNGTLQLRADQKMGLLEIFQATQAREEARKQAALNGGSEPKSLSSVNNEKGTA
jgi:chromatin segregation and condensation protein Rec8/ScpA/Scc1 (kleisin family)